MLNEKDIKITKIHYGSAVLIKHIPTDIAAYYNKHKSQVKNKECAISILKRELVRQEGRIV